jgi:predicted phosphohydrolase
VADVLILAGDIAVGWSNVQHVIKQFHDKHIIFVPGNHEYYNHTMLEMNDLLFTRPNVHVLNPGSITIEDITFIGATLWTNFGEDPLASMAATSMINDFRLISRFNPINAKRLFDQEFDFIKQQYEQTKGKKIIVTHFMPCIELVHPKWGASILNKYFANNLSDWVSNLTDATWCFGHTHDSIQAQIGETKLYCNPKGYRGENPVYQRQLITP